MAKRSLREVKAQLTQAENLILTGLYSGWFRPAPGTWGSAFALIPALSFAKGGLAGAAALLVVVCITFYVSVSVIDQVEARTGLHDAGEIVIDEWVGQWIALLPVIYWYESWYWWLVAFVLFRIFDILKPWPIGWLDRRISGGFGVMIDDVIAGIIAALCLIIAKLWGL